MKDVATIQKQQQQMAFSLLRLTWQASLSMGLSRRRSPRQAVMGISRLARSAASDGFSSVCLSHISALIYGLDTTIAADVQGSIVEAFVHVDQLAWIGAGFPLGSVAVVLPIGVLSTRFNMKWLYISSLVLFEVDSAVCGAAPNMNAIIVGRVIAGAGGAGLFLGCLNYFSTHHDGAI
ncbi:hypothetical protein TGAMA5MH_03861 [Trichoderma gamsii]|uniref:Major facilitator superfamily (MFS) profile domain-containing protein n=1 Tax=Trichoderma gamsii TaxID=398673 RepID=A0A2K0TFF6_9HYPO|nr:hypothetical protein TGAMA5MH_03861 [Trichoderma gamsii]